MSPRREEILDAALSIADEQGLSEVSMRAVAERVGVTPMALYSHVKGKAGLLDAMAGRLMAELLPRGAEIRRASWKARLGHFAHAARKRALRRPWAAELLFSRPSVTADTVRLVDHLYTLLIEAGVPPHEVPRVERLVSTFVLGYAASEAGGRFGERHRNARARRELLPSEEAPAHDQLAEWLDKPRDWDAEFQADLDDLGILIESIAAKVR